MTLIDEADGFCNCNFSPLWGRFSNCNCGLGKEKDIICGRGGTEPRQWLLLGRFLKSFFEGITKEK
ncbi:MAG: hypothetical protein ACTSRF_13190 [Candidatus Freyarchaeota archaeon]